MDTKSFKFEIKSIADTGEFEGIASIYGIEDLGNDVIEPGAFTKTIQENPEVPILWQHDRKEVIGSGRMSEEGSIVLIKGTLDMGDPVAVKAHGKMKNRLIKGLSIGFNTVKVTWEELKDKYVRHINELKLHEVSVVTFPMLTAAQVTSVKSAEFSDYILERAQEEVKAGRRLSAATRTAMEGIMADHQMVMDGHLTVMNKLKALLTEDATAGKSAAGAGTGAAATGTEPGNHSGLVTGIDAMLAMIPR